MKLTKAFFEDVRKLILSARTTVARGVDLVQVHTNFEIGRRIVEQELRGKDRAAYGKEVMKALSERLTREFGKGFSHTNLKLMRLFYLQNQHRIGQSLTDQSASPAKLQSNTAKSGIRQSPTRKLAKNKKVHAPSAKSAVGEIGQSLTDQLTSSAQTQRSPFTLSWTHYVFLFGVKNPDERSFYEIEATAQDWKVRELKRQFDSSLYERLALSRDKDGIRKLARESVSARPIHPFDPDPTTPCRSSPPDPSGMSAKILRKIRPPGNRSIRRKPAKHS